MSLRSIILSVKSPDVTSEFFSKVLGLGVFYENGTTVELRGNRTQSIPIIIKEATSAASLSVGYTPILNFDVPNIEDAVHAALERGGMLDGSIKYKNFGKVAAIRSPDGYTLGLFEPSVSEEDE